MIEQFAVPVIDEFEAQVPTDTQVVFHGVNKSGSLAMAAAMRDAYALAGRSGEFYAHYFQPRLSLEDYVQAVGRRAGHCFFVAHYLYGSLPPRANRVLVTQFRHPLPRVLSCYNWLKLDHKKRGRPGSFRSLDEWVERTKGKAHSQIAQFGIGFDKLAAKKQNTLTAENVFDICVTAVEREVFCFGIAERFEESIFLFAALCRLPRVAPWIRDQRNPGRVHSSEVAPATRDLIEEVFRYDYMLYKHMLEIFDQRIARINLGPDLERYKLACAPQYNDRVLSIQDSE